MRRLFLAMTLCIPGFVWAGPLEDADKFLMAGAYDKALPIYATLAKAGNIEAEFRLGEMYWYGDGTAPDVDLATAWMQKAAARGHAGAIESLAILRQRAARGADIAWWTSGYDGNDLVSGRYACPAPAMPGASTTGMEVRKTTSAYTAWQECYKDFVANLNSVQPLGKRIPADVAALMTPREAQQAVAHLNAVYDRVLAQKNSEALAIGAGYGKWEKASEVAIESENKARRLEYQILRDQLLERQQEIKRDTRPIIQPTVR